MAAQQQLVAALSAELAHVRAALAAQSAALSSVVQALLPLRDEVRSLREKLLHAVALRLIVRLPELEALPLALRSGVMLRVGESRAEVEGEMVE